MGMYTGLRGTIHIKENKRIPMAFAIDARISGVDFWSKLLPTNNIWHNVGRKNFIPFGFVSYMPEDWGENKVDFDYTTGILNFTCSLKNYNSEIETFIEQVLPEIADFWDLEELYEEFDETTRHVKEL